MNYSVRVGTNSIQALHFHCLSHISYMSFILMSSISFESNAVDPPETTSNILKFHKKCDQNFVPRRDNNTFLGGFQPGYIPIILKCNHGWNGQPKPQLIIRSMTLQSTYIVDSTKKHYPTPISTKVTRSTHIRLL